MPPAILKRTVSTKHSIGRKIAGFIQKTDLLLNLIFDGMTTILLDGPLEKPGLIPSDSRVMKHEAWIKSRTNPMFSQSDALALNISTDKNNCQKNQAALSVNNRAY